MKEANYIRLRKWKAFGNRLCFYLCRVFPVKKNLISVCTFEGKGGYGCNPKYIVRELHRSGGDYEFVWFVDDPDKKFPGYIRKVPNTLWSRAYWLSRSAVWIDNYRKPYGTCKRRGQYYLNTNHYNVGFKCTGLWRGNGFSRMAWLVSKSDSDQVDELIIDSDWAEEVSPKGFVYDGSYLKTGAPRCDVLYGDRSRQKRRFRKRHSLEEDAKVLLFAPTFREGSVNGRRTVFSEIWSIDFKRLIHNLEKKFGGKWYLCIRVHPQLAPIFQEYRDEEIQDRLIDESKTDDMYELMAGMDAYITDYSSAAFEAGYAKLPVFLYADDIEEYARARGDLMWNFTSDPLDRIQNNKKITPDFDVVLPFSISRNNDELEANLLAYDEKEYFEKLDTLHRRIGLVFDGQASKKVAGKIAQIIHKKDRKSK